MISDIVVDTIAEQARSIGDDIEREVNSELSDMPVYINDEAGNTYELSRADITIDEANIVIETPTNNNRKAEKVTKLIETIKELLNEIAVD